VGSGNATVFSNEVGDSCMQTHVHASLLRLFDKVHIERDATHAEHGQIRVGSTQACVAGQVHILKFHVAGLKWRSAACQNFVHDTQLVQNLHPAELEHVS